MKIKLLLAAATVLIGAAAVGQLRITSFTRNGEITWTNSATHGAYRVAWANSPTGAWNAFETPTNLNLILADSNHVTVQLPLTNAPTFYRVAWIPPDPIGVWNYLGYDFQGTLVTTGQLDFRSKTLLNANPPVYGVRGTWNLQYTGSGNSSCVYNQIGNGGFGGNLDVPSASLFITWPTNITDDNLDLEGTLWPDVWSGDWYQWPCGGGTFTATRRQ